MPAAVHSAHLAVATSPGSGWRHTSMPMCHRMAANSYHGGHHSGGRNGLRRPHQLPAGLPQSTARQQPHSCSSYAACSNMLSMAARQAVTSSTDQFTVATPRLLTARLSSAPDCHAVLQLLECNTQHLDAIHISAALVRAARLQELQPLRQHHATKSRSGRHKHMPVDPWLNAVASLCESLLGPEQAAGAAEPSALTPAGPLLAACGVRELANICWALAKLGRERPLAHVAQAVLNLSQQVPAKAHVQHSVEPASVQAHEQATGHKMAAQHYSSRSNNSTSSFLGSAANLHDSRPAGAPASATGWHAGCGSFHSGMAQHLSSRVVPHVAPCKVRAGDRALHAATPQALANLLWAFAHWFADCGDGAATVHDSLDSSSTNDKTWTNNGHASVPDTEWSLQSVSTVHTRTAQLPVQDNYSIQDASALGGSLHHGSSLTAVHAALEALCAAMLYNLHRASPLDLALTVWSLATLNFVPRTCTLLSAITATIPSTLPGQSTQGIASIIWGLAKLSTGGRRHEASQSWNLSGGLVSTMVDHALETVRTQGIQPREAGMLMQGLAMLDSKRQGLWQEVQYQVAQVGVHYWPPGCISNLLTAYAKARRPCWQVVEALHYSVTPTHMCLATYDGHPSLNPPASVPVAAMQPTVSLAQPPQQQQQPSLFLLDEWLDQELVMSTWALAVMYVRTTRALKLLQRQQGARWGVARHNKGQRPCNVAPEADMVQDAGNSRVVMLRHIMQHLLQEVRVRAQQGKLPPSSVAMAIWAASTCELYDSQLVIACMDHAAKNMQQYRASHLVAVLQAIGSIARGGASHVSKQDTAFQESRTLLWTAFMHIVDARLPHMMHTQLTAICEAAVHTWGALPRRLASSTLQLVLDAVMIRAQHAQQQQQQASAGRSATEPTEPHPGRKQQQQQQQSVLHSRNNKESRGLNTQDAHAVEARHMPTPATIATLMWALTCSGCRSTFLFQLAAVVMGDADGSSRLSPKQAERLLWACARGNMYSSKLFAKLCGKLGIHLGSLSPGTLCDVLGLIAGSRHTEPLLVRAACQQLQQQRHGLGPQNAAVLMWSIAQMNAGALLEWRPPLTLLVTLVPEMCMEAQLLTLWAVAVQQHVLLGSATRPAGSMTAATGSGFPAPLRSEPHLAAAEQAAKAMNGTGEAFQAAMPTARLQASAHPGTDALMLLHTLLQHTRDMDVQSVVQHPYAGMLLGQALSWLLASSRPEVQAAAAGCMLAWPIKLRTHVQACLLSTSLHDSMLVRTLKGYTHSPGWQDNQDGKQQGAQHVVQLQVPGASQQVRRAAQRVRSSSVDGTSAAEGPRGLGLPDYNLPSDLSWYMEVTVSSTSMLGSDAVHTSRARKELQTLHKQLIGALQGLDLTVASFDRLQKAPSHKPSSVGAEGQQGISSNSSGDDAVYDAETALPSSFPGLLVFLPGALPRPTAIILAPACAFARSSAPEPLGPLFMTQTLLSDHGWHTAVLDARTWGMVQGRAQQQQFLFALLQSWGVRVPADL